MWVDSPFVVLCTDTCIIDSQTENTVGSEVRAAETRRVYSYGHERLVRDEGAEREQLP